MDGALRRVMIACVTFETFKITEPVKFYGTNVVYLIHYVLNPSEKNIYQEFYDRNVEILREWSKDVEIHGLERKVTDFAQMLRTVNAIIDEERPKSAEILINLSAGSPEYTAAASTASMMNPFAKSFFVRPSEYTVDPEDLRDIYYRDGKPVGLTKSVKKVTDMPEFRLEKPEEYLIKSLRIYESLKSGPRLYSSKVINKLKEDGLWDRGMSGNPSNDKVFFQRRFINAWKDRGWVVKDGPSYSLTDKGRLMISVLYPEGEDLEGRDNASVPNALNPKSDA